jgi:hypothetical protein
VTILLRLSCNQQHIVATWITWFTCRNVNPCVASARRSLLDCACPFPTRCEFTRQLVPNYFIVLIMVTQTFASHVGASTCPSVGQKSKSPSALATHCCTCQSQAKSRLDNSANRRPLSHCAAQSRSTTELRAVAEGPSPFCSSILFIDRAYNAPHTIVQSHAQITLLFNTNIDRHIEGCGLIGRSGT